MTEEEVWEITLPRLYYIDKGEVKVAYHIELQGGAGEGMTIRLYDSKCEYDKDCSVLRTPEDVYKTKEEAEKHLKEEKHDGQDAVLEDRAAVRGA